ncbi:MAG: AlwI family type II restriction endonuclease [Planctomycetia bacterium]|nr:AlwI family type II restriction endonuclease [Planctomycetia bacterium]
MPKKLWSMSTTVRNPYRIKEFLRVFSGMEGEEWNHETQKRFQILLIQNRLYVPQNDTLSDSQNRRLHNPMYELSFEDAKEIFESKQYRDSPMRGRTSYKPLEKVGLAFVIDKKILISELGKLWLADKIEIDDLWFRSLIRWQYPNPLSSKFQAKDGYNTKPFISTLLLIQRVNQFCKKHGWKEKGISKKELGIFALSLIDYRDIEKTAEKLCLFRQALEKRPVQEQNDYQISFTQEYLQDYDNYSESNLRDYTDNVIRYFRLTKYIYIRGGGYYIDLEPRRSIELKKLFQLENGKVDVFSTKKEYIDSMLDIANYCLPWENVPELRRIASRILKDIRRLQETLGLEVVHYALGNTRESLEKQILTLRELRTHLQSMLLKREYTNVEKINETVQKLENIKKLPEKRSIALEKYIYLALNILNDAMQIKTNAPLGDDLEPTFTAPANVPDMECEYQDFRSICEVTTLTGRDQWFHEGQPVMRHLRDYEIRYPDKQSYCLFIAPAIHRDTRNTFWAAIKYEYEGKPQRIIPLTITQMTQLLEKVKQWKEWGISFRHTDLKRLFDLLLNVQNITHSEEWIEKNNVIFENWIQNDFSSTT